jgi:transposase
LTDVQAAEIVNVVIAGPEAAGYSTGIWTGPMIGDWIRRQFGIAYHNHHIPRLLNQLGFSMQRPRKRLARADAKRQAHWLRKRFPAIKKKPLLAVA